MIRYKSIFHETPVPAILLSVDPESFKVKDVNAAFLDEFEGHQLSYKEQEVNDVLNRVGGLFGAYNKNELNRQLTSCVHLKQPNTITVRSHADQPGHVRVLEIQNVPLVVEGKAVANIVQFFKIGDASDEINKGTRKPPQLEKVETTIVQELPTVITGDPTILDLQSGAYGNVQTEMLNYFTVPVWIYEMETSRFLYVNEAACTLYGYSSEDYATMTLKDLRVEQDVPKLEQALKDSKRNMRNAYPFVFRHRKKDGSIIYVKIENRAIRFNGINARMAIAVDITAELTTQNELISANQWLDAAQQIAHLGYWSNDLLNKKIYWSKELYKIFELDPDTFSLTFVNIKERYHSEERFFFDEFQTDSPKDGTTVTKERRILKRDGGFKWIAERIHYILDEFGKPVKMEGVVFDINLLKTTQLSLKRSEDKYRNIFNSNPLPTWIYNVDTLRFIDVNESACRIYGYTRDEFLNMSLLDIRPTEDFSALSDAVKKVKQKSYNDNPGIYRHIKKNGAVMFVRIESTKLDVEDSSFRIAVAIDVTDSLKQEKVIVESNYKLRTAQQIAKFGYWTHDLKSKTIQWSDEMYRLYGVDPATFELNMPNILKCVHPDDRYVFNSRSLTSESSMVWEVEHRVITTAGKEKWLYGKLRLEAENGIPSKLDGVMMDITDRKNGEKAILRKTQLLTTLNKFVSGLLANEDWLSVLEKSKSIIGTTLGIDRIFYFENWENPETGMFYACLKLKWTRDDAEYKVDYPHLVRMPFSEYTHAVSKLKQGKLYESLTICIEDPVFKASLDKANVRSILMIPVMVFGKFFGFVSFHDCKTDRIWEEDEKMFLESMVLNIATKLEKEKIAMQSNQNRRQFESVIANLPGISIRRSAIGDMPLVFISDEIERITGYKAQDILNGDPIWDHIVFPDDRQTVFGTVKNLAPGQLFTVEFRVICKNGELKWLRGRGKSVTNDKGEAEFIDGVIIDISENHKQQVLLLESNERYKMVMKASVEAIMDWDILENTFVLGDGFRDVFGYDVDNGKNEIWPTQIYYEDKAQVMRSLHDAMDDHTKDNFYAEYRFMKADHTLAYVQQRGMFLRNEQGDAIRLVSAIMDVSDSVRHVHEMKKQNDALREIAWIQSHVVRAPLASLMALVDILKSKDFGTMDEAFVLENIAANARKLDNIVRTIVDKASKVPIEEFSMQESGLL